MKFLALLIAITIFSVHNSATAEELALIACEEVNVVDKTRNTVVLLEQLGTKPIQKISSTVNATDIISYDDVRKTSAVLFRMRVYRNKTLNDVQGKTRMQVAQELAQQDPTQSVEGFGYRKMYNIVFNTHDGSTPKGRLLVRLNDLANASFDLGDDGGNYSCEQPQVVPSLETATLRQGEEDEVVYEDTLG